MADIKYFLQSKTLWFNALVMLMGILQEIQANKGQGALIIAIAVIGIIIRFYTNKPVGIPETEYLDLTQPTPDKV